MVSPRALKIHEDIRAIKFLPKARYVFVMRDPRDIAHSFWLTHQKLDDWSRTKTGVPPPMPFLDFWNLWKVDGSPYWEFLDNILGWWSHAEVLPNILLLHYNNLKKDVRKEIRRIAEFVGVTLSDWELELVVAHTSIDHMRARPSIYDSRNINTASGERWKDVLTPEHHAEWNATMEAHWPPALIHWSLTGQLPATHWQVTGVPPPEVVDVEPDAEPVVPETNAGAKAEL